MQSKQTLTGGSSSNNGISQIFKTGRTKKFLKWGLVAVIGASVYHIYNENKPTDEIVPIKPNTILYVKTSQIPSSEAAIGKYRSRLWHSFLKRFDEEKLLDKNRYLETVLPQYNFQDYLMAIERATADDNVIGLVLQVDHYGLGLAQTQELRSAIQKFVDQSKQKNKKICITYSDHFTSRGGYWLASAFPRVFMHPSGVFEMPNKNTRLFYIKDLLEKFGIFNQKFAREEHKHYGNSFTFKGTEEEFAKEPLLQNEVKDNAKLIEEVSRIIESDIAASRLKHIAVKNQIQEFMVSKSVSALLKHCYPALEAQKIGLVDSLEYQDSVFTKVIEEVLKNDSTAIVKANGQKVPVPYHIISLEDYAHNRILEQQKLLRNYPLQTEERVVQKKPAEKSKVERMQIGVITFHDNINEANSYKILHQLNKARDSKNLDAVVVRINCPGGDSIVSDTVRHHLEQVRATGKRVVVSMGDIAASGGYLMATPADKIVANPVTLTGSIGVVGIRTSISQQVLGDHGVRSKKVGPDQRGDMFEELSTEETAEVNQIVDCMYEDFVAHVAKSRKMSIEQAKAIAGGRVYTGSQALECGLVDELGGLREAIDIARLSDMSDKTSFKRPYVLQPIQGPTKSAYFKYSEYLRTWQQMLQSALSGLKSFESKVDN